MVRSLMTAASTLICASIFSTVSLAQVPYSVFVMPPGKHLVCRGDDAVQCQRTMWVAIYPCDRQYEHNAICETYCSDGGHAPSPWTCQIIKLGEGPGGACGYHPMLITCDNGR